MRLVEEKGTKTARRLNVMLASNVGISLLLFALVAGFVTYSLAFRQERLEAMAIQRQLVATVQAQAEVAAFAVNDAIAQGVLEGLAASPYVLGARLEGMGGFKREQSRRASLDFAAGTQYPLMSPVNRRERIGMLAIVQNDETVNQIATRQAAFQTFLLLAQLVLATLVVTAIVRRRMVEPLARLAGDLASIPPGSSRRLSTDEANPAAELETVTRSVNGLLEATQVAIEQERSLRVFQETAGKVARIGGWEFSLETGDLAWSREVYEILERDPAHPIDREAANQYVVAAARSELAKAMQRAIDEHQPFDLELPLQTESGRLIWARIQARVESVRGRPPRVIGALQDITDRKQAEFSARSADQRTTIVFRTSPIAIAIASQAEGRFVEINDAMVDLLGRSREEIVGRTSLEVNYWDSPATRNAWFEALKTHGSLNGYEVTLLDAGGRERTVLMSSSPIDFAGEPCIINFLHDVSDRKRLENQLLEYNQRLEEIVAERTAAMEVALTTLHRAQDELTRSEAKATLSTLIASISHELNTPIGNSVLTSSSLSDEVAQFKRRVESHGIKRSEFADFLDHLLLGTALMQRNLNRAEVLVKKFRQVAADQASEQRRSFDLATVVLEIVDTLSPSLKRLPHRIEVLIPEGITIDSYPGPFGQIVINLINNAYLHAFTDMAEGVFAIRATQEGDFVRMSFADNGRGMSDEEKAHLFEPFFSTKIGEGGTGLGMSIVDNLARKTLGGRVTVTSVLAQGTTVEIVFPRVAPMPANDGG